jgi:hypothetical protein
VTRRESKGNLNKTMAYMRITRIIKNAKFQATKSPQHLDVTGLILVAGAGNQRYLHLNFARL